MLSVAHQYQVELARDLSAEGRTEYSGLPRRRQGEGVLRGGLGAGDEGPRSNFASHGEADHVVAGSGDPGDLGSQYAALAILIGAIVVLAVGTSLFHQRAELLPLPRNWKAMIR